ncbi:MAG TPA: DNA methyltransferase, partial [Rikenellaceae bacterium]|nr:DNA methyltransferase [Rikenellaceae bacterium]
LPYSGVSTAIMIFSKTNAGGTDKVWFYDMRADGFSLDQKRNPVEENDIPDVISRYRNMSAEAGRTRQDQSFLVPVEEIRRNGYNLSLNKYREVKVEKVQYESSDKLLDELDDYEKEIVLALKEFREKYL